MGILIAYGIGFLCIIFPKVCANVIAELLDQLTKYKYGATTEEQKQVRPVFSVIVGIVIISFTYAIQIKSID